MGIFQLHFMKPLNYFFLFSFSLSIYSTKFRIHFLIFSNPSKTNGQGFSIKEANYIQNHYLIMGLFKHISINRLIINSH